MFHPMSHETPAEVAAHFAADPTAQTAVLRQRDASDHLCGYVVVTRHGATSEPFGLGRVFLTAVAEATAEVLVRQGNPYDMGLPEAEEAVAVAAYAAALDRKAATK